MSAYAHTVVDVVCDSCDLDAQNGLEYTMWSRAESARRDAESRGWFYDAEIELDLCPSCRTAG